MVGREDMSEFLADSILFLFGLNGFKDPLLRRVGDFDMEFSIITGV